MIRPQVALKFCCRTTRGGAAASSLLPSSPLLLRAVQTARQPQPQPNCGAQQLHYYSTSSPSLLAEKVAAVSTAQLVKQLRESTGAPMMECKKALSSPEVNNDLQLAKEWLRKHGSAKAISKVAGREALEGLVGLHIFTPELGQENDNGVAVTGTATVAALVKVSSETDFASRSAIFSNFVQEVAIAAATASSSTTGTQHEDDLDIPKFLTNATTRTGKTLHEALNDAILAIRENLAIDTISVLKSTDSLQIQSQHEQHQQHSSAAVFGGYVHGKVAPDVNCGNAAAIVELQVATSDDAHSAAATISIVQEAAKKLAMHIVAAKPLYVNIESVPPEAVQKEKEILLAKMEMEASSSSGNNKKRNTPEIQEKIISGQLRKYYESVCLMEQPHMVEEGNPKVGKVLARLGVVVKDFRFMSMMLNK